MRVFVEARTNFHHLAHLSDERGLMEHALGSEPRHEHGYCVDDVARALVVLCRESASMHSCDPTTRRLESLYLTFVLASVAADGRCHNRMNPLGDWTDKASLGDWWGRALWALGAAAAMASTPGARARALAGFRVAAQQRSPHRHAMAFAALGAAHLLDARPDEDSAQRLLAAAARTVDGPGISVDWPWPEARLTYANGAIAEAIIVAGDLSGDQRTVQRGLQLLSFLLAVQTRNDHLSVIPAQGLPSYQRSGSPLEPAFDQQPIEVAALADACAAAFRITGEKAWVDGIRMAWLWFLGDNDTCTPMFDPDSGAGFDGLEANGRNANQGAESTLAMLSTAQQARAHAGLI